MFVWFGSCWLVIFGNVSCLLVLCSLELCGCFDEEGVCIVVVIVVFVYGGDVVQVEYVCMQGQVFIDVVVGDQILGGVCFGEGGVGVGYQLFVDMLCIQVE